MPPHDLAFLAAWIERHPLERGIRCYRAGRRWHVTVYERAESIAHADAVELGDAMSIAIETVWRREVLKAEVAA